MHNQNSNIGVFFSGNDVVYDWLVAFLNSFRTFNPDLRLVLIPFNNQCERLVRLSDAYGFEVYEDTFSFKRLEAIGRAFELGHTPTGPYWFRRYAAFWGPCDRFMYLDARQVVLANVKPAISALDKFDFELLHFDCALDQVYEPGELRTDLLRAGKARGFNSGRWIARKGLFTIEDFEELASDALKVRHQLNPRNTDQAFINYCCDMKSVRYGHVSEVLGNLCHIHWARQPGTIYQDKDYFYLWDYGGTDHKKQLLLVHWAGFKLSPIMPNRKIFEKYYLQFRTPWFGFWFIVWTCFRYLMYTPFVFLRTNRYLNTAYHRLKSLFSQTNCYNDSCED
jgi:hypothetical protein